MLLQRSGTAGLGVAGSGVEGRVLAGRGVEGRGVTIAGRGVTGGRLVVVALVVVLTVVGIIRRTVGSEKIAVIIVRNLDSKYVNANQRHGLIELRLNKRFVG